MDSDQELERSDGDASDKASETSCSVFYDEKTTEQRSGPEISSSPPDGGIQAWLQVLSGFLLYFNSWGLVTAFGVFQIFYKSTFIPSSSNSAISWIGTMQGFLLALGSVFAGCVLDRGHPRRLIICGGFFVIFGLMMISLCRTYWQLMLAQGLCIGLGAGQLFIVAVAVLPGWFAKRRAIATGLAATGSSLGGVVYPIIFHKLEPRIGFAWTLRVIGFVALATCLISLTCSRQRTLPPPRPKLVDFTGFREPLFALFAAVSFVGALSLYVPFFYIVEFAKHKGGVNDALAFYMLPILSAGSILGRTLPALAADRFGCLRVLTFTTAASAILAFCWAAVYGEAATIIWSVLYGAFSGAFVSLQTPTVAAVTPDMRFVGGRMGMNNFCFALGILVGNPIAGAIGGAFEHWLGVQVFCGVSLVVSTVLLAVTWFVKEGAGTKK
ncbi:hypothetical protein DOTSEDRAFT_90398 [Dothistroma septosporum NZE10]|uniref:Major facilitator superfamily (MFS) profile domain-containing protein n=1 Tax=Dothistroma septosporum (strain NZE10 / CBS 128990) TaxID=675120 RepID=N1PGT5_DOTSN|nr:hypothetical protein DOTSEDRAFT_90398 [Dothistroma septosporum NZE10]